MSLVIISFECNIVESNISSIFDVVSDGSFVIFFIFDVKYVSFSVIVVSVEASDDVCKFLVGVFGIIGGGIFHEEWVIDGVNAEKFEVVEVDKIESVMNEFG